VRFIKDVLTDFVGTLSHVKGNAKVITLTQSLWSIPYNLYNPFITQYMLALGLSGGQVGLISSVGLMFGVVISLFAGYATDRLGRRWAFLIADLVTWGLGCLLWAFASDFAWFVAAGLSQSFIRLVTVPYNCLLVEDTPPENRLSVYSVLNFTIILANFCAPLMNLIINPYGLVPAMRMVLLASTAVYTATFVARHFLLKETAISLRRKAESRSETPFSSLADYRRIVRELFRSRELLLFIAIRSLYYIQANVRGTYLSVMIVQGLGFPVSTLGTVNVASGLVALAAQVAVLPRYARRDAHNPILAYLALAVASNVILFLAPAGNLPYLMASIAMGTFGLIILQMLIDSTVANKMPDADRASLIGLATLVMVVTSAPIQYLSGWLADIPSIGPRLPLLVMTAFLLGTLWTCLVSRRHKAAAGEGRPQAG